MLRIESSGFVLYNHKMDWQLPEARKGRGAVSNRGRFETTDRFAIDMVGRVRATSRNALRPPFPLIPPAR